MDGNVNKDKDTKVVVRKVISMLSRREERVSRAREAVLSVHARFVASRGIQPSSAIKTPKANQRGKEAAAKRERKEMGSVGMMAKDGEARDGLRMGKVGSNQGIQVGNNQGSQASIPSKWKHHLSTMS